MGHKIKYGAKIFLKINFFPYLPTHFFGGHVTGNQHIIYFGPTVLTYHLNLKMIHGSRLSAVKSYSGHYKNIYKTFQTNLLSTSYKQIGGGGQKGMLSPPPPPPQEMDYDHSFYSIYCFLWLGTLWLYFPLPPSPPPPPPPAKSYQHFSFSILFFLGGGGVVSSKLALNH